MVDRFRLPHACVEPGAIEMLMKVADHFGFAITIGPAGVHAVYDRPVKASLRPLMRVESLPLDRLEKPQEEVRLSA